MKTVINCENLCKTIKKHEILKNVSIKVGEGQIVGIMGRNGSGKSMLFKIICGLVIPTSGNIEVFGENILNDGSFPKDLGVLIEYPGFLPQFSGYKNLKLLADIQNLIGKQEIIQAIKIVGLDPEDKRSYRKYSLGMRQKLGLAAAIMEKPKLIILDEPTNNLDEESIIEFREFLMNTRDEGATILLASHNKNDIEYCCDKVYNMSNGVLTEDCEGKK